MKTRLLITSYDMEIGGVERSLASMLSNFNYNLFDVDLHLHSHSGPLMELIDSRVNLLSEKQSCKTFRMGIKDTFLSGFPTLSIQRLRSRFSADKMAKNNNSNDASYFQFQHVWDNCHKHVEPINEQYDVAISYLWPHHYTAFNVEAKIKVAWIHTDYSTIDIDVERDLEIWNEFDYIISISDACTQAFLLTHPTLKSKLILVENLTAPDYVKRLAQKPAEKKFSTGFNLVSVGRLCNAKAFDRAVQVLAELDVRGYKDINWYIVGEGSDRALIELEIAKYQLQDRFILLGSTTNPYPYMKAADVYIQPSRYEGKAVTVGEALILAKPVIITNYPTATSQIDHCINGIICEQTVFSIANAIVELYNSDCQRLEFKRFNQNIDYLNIEELEKLYKVIIRK